MLISLIRQHILGCEEVECMAQPTIELINVVLISFINIFGIHLKLNYRGNCEINLQPKFFKMCLKNSYYTLSHQHHWLTNSSIKACTYYLKALKIH